jgi:hypothetical protein
MLLLAAVLTVNDLMSYHHPTEAQIGCLGLSKLGVSRHIVAFRVSEHELINWS